MHRCPWCLVSRDEPGNGGDAVFCDDTDGQRFLGRVSELPGRFSLEVHAFVLMRNRYHPPLRCRLGNLSAALGCLNQSYASRFNWARRRQGHVFHGRFKAVLLTDESALDEVVRFQADLLLGLPWLTMTDRQGAWGRDAVLAVATRHLGWRLSRIHAVDVGGGGPGGSPTRASLREEQALPGFGRGSPMPNVKKRDLTPLALHWHNKKPFFGLLETPDVPCVAGFD
ncbi:MAG: hypothetical protein EXS30_08950 [Pedosphaera sp.]|nr:hypothetical protein [Pedosphaera sp.]